MSFIDYLAQGGGADSAAALTTQFGTYLATTGVDYYAYCDCSKIKGAKRDDRDPLIATNYPRAWTQRYRRETLFEVDPAIQHAPRQNQLYRWNELELSDEQNRFIVLASRAGLHSGVSVPIHERNRVLVVSLAVSRDKAILDEKLPELAISAHQFHEYNIHLGVADRAQTILSKNAVEVLKWLSAGKTPEEIAVLLQMSRHGVYWLIADAKRKLGARNTVHLLAKAMILRLIPL